MTRRLIIHAGFHKTGTTTLQAFLRQNADVLSEQFSLLLSPLIRPIQNACFKYSETKNASALVEFSEILDAYFVEFGSNDTRDLVISTEDFSGQLPGRGKVENYEAIYAISNEILTVAKNSKLFDQIIFYFSTREFDSWIESLYWHMVQNSNEVRDLSEYIKIAETFESHEEMIVKIKSIVGEENVITADLKDTTHKKFGPAHPFIELLNPSPEIREKLVDVTARRLRLTKKFCRQLLSVNRNKAIKNAEKYRLKQEMVEIVQSRYMRRFRKNDQV